MTSAGRRRCAAAAVGAVLVLAGCSSAGEPTADAQPQPAPSTPDQPAGPRREAAPADLAGFSCVRRPGRGWVASGAVTNSGREPARYRLTVVTLGGAEEVQGQRTERLRVRPGESAEFRWRDLSRGPADLCLPRLQRLRP